MIGLFITNDGETTEAHILKYGVETKSGHYTYFVTYDILDRPTVRVAAWPSGIVQSEMGALLYLTTAQHPEGTHAADRVRHRDGYFLDDHLGSSDS